ncbi:biotin--[acetyl-CoA-carboxylase] ligase [Sulfurimonas sp.]|nr:biotin--[acetyl-CoA-carboxylase] ligase [Sulfurimonas sp.]
MKITYLESIDSTQSYLKELIAKNKVKAPCAVVAKTQTNGVGSRNNQWLGMDGNLFLSFAIPLELLPKDLKLESASIYFAYILKSVLDDLNSSVWLKWPNDFYIDDRKIGGMITNIVSNTVICGVGLNLVSSPDDFTTLDIKISKEELVGKYLENIEKYISWKQVFSKYKIEFCRNKNFFTHVNEEKISLGKVELQSDGSIKYNGKRIYSTR